LVFTDGDSLVPTSKRPRYFETQQQEEYIPIPSDDEHADQDSEEEFDPETYYETGKRQNTPDVIQKFVESTFTKCMPKPKRRKVARDFPKPALDVLKVPKADRDIVSILGKDFPTKVDKELSKVQAAILAAPAPLLSLWSQLEDQSFSGKPDELVPSSVVLKSIRETVALIGNASIFISMQRRLMVIQGMRKDRPRLADFLQDICKDDIGKTGTELFGPVARKKILERADTIKAFNRTVSEIEGPSTSKPQQNHFLGKGSGASRYSNSQGRHATHQPYRNANYANNANRRIFKPNYGNTRFPRGQGKRFQSSTPTPSTK
jgi:hypothetical protein